MSTTPKTIELSELLATVRLPLSVHTDNVCTRSGQRGKDPMFELHHGDMMIARCSIYSFPMEAAYLAHAANQLPALVAALETLRKEIGHTPFNQPSHVVNVTLSKWAKDLDAALTAAKSVPLP